MRTAVILALLACCRPGAAQAPTPKRDNNQLSADVRLYTPKNINEGRARQVAEFVNTVIGKGVRVDWSDVPQALVIRGATPADLDTAEALLKRFDVPANERGTMPTPALKMQGDEPNIDCVVYLIRASHAAPRTGANAPATAPIPAELQSVVDELKHNFGYEHYALWDMQVIRSTGEFQGMLPQTPAVTQGAIEMYNMVYRGVRRTLQSKTCQSMTSSSPSRPTACPTASTATSRLPLTSARAKSWCWAKSASVPPTNTDLFLVLTTKPR